MAETTVAPLPSPRVEQPSTSSGGSAVTLNGGERGSALVAELVEGLNSRDALELIARGGGENVGANSHDAPESLAGGEEEKTGADSHAGLESLARGDAIVIDIAGVKAQGGDDASLIAARQASQKKAEERNTSWREPYMLKREAKRKAKEAENALGDVPEEPTEVVPQTKLKRVTKGVKKGVKTVAKTGAEALADTVQEATKHPVSFAGQMYERVIVDKAIRAKDERGDLVKSGSLGLTELSAPFQHQLQAEAKKRIESVSADRGVVGKVSDKVQDIARRAVADRTALDRAEHAIAGELVAVLKKPPEQRTEAEVALMNSPLMKSYTDDLSGQSAARQAMLETQAARDAFDRSMGRDVPKVAALEGKQREQFMQGLQSLTADVASGTYTDNDLQLELAIHALLERVGLRDSLSYATNIKDVVTNLAETINESLPHVNGAANIKEVAKYFQEKNIVVNVGEVTDETLADVEGQRSSVTRRAIDRYRSGGGAAEVLAGDAVAARAELLTAKKSEIIAAVAGSLVGAALVRGGSTAARIFGPFVGGSAVAATVAARRAGKNVESSIASTRTAVARGGAEAASGKMKDIAIIPMADMGETTASLGKIMEQLQGGEGASQGTIEQALAAMGSVDARNKAGDSAGYPLWMVSSDTKSSFHEQQNAMETKRAAVMVSVREKAGLGELKAIAARLNIYVPDSTDKDMYIGAITSSLSEGLQANITTGELLGGQLGAVLAGESVDKRSSVSASKWAARVHKQKIKAATFTSVMALGSGMAATAVADDLFAKAMSPKTAPPTHALQLNGDRIQLARAEVPLGSGQGSGVEHTIAVADAWEKNRTVVKSVSFGKGHEQGLLAQIVQGKQKQPIVQLRQHGNSDHFAFQVRKDGHFKTILVESTRGHGNATLDLDPTATDDIRLVGGKTMSRGELSQLVLQTKGLNNLPVGAGQLTPPQQEHLFSGVTSVGAVHVRPLAHGVAVRYDASFATGGHMHEGTVSTVKEAITNPPSGEVGEIVKPPSVPEVTHLKFGNRWFDFGGHATLSETGGLVDTKGKQLFTAHEMQQAASMLSTINVKDASGNPIELEYILDFHNEEPALDVVDAHTGRIYLDDVRVAPPNDPNGGGTLTYTPGHVIDNEKSMTLRSTIESGPRQSTLSLSGKSGEQLEIISGMSKMTLNGHHFDFAGIKVDQDGVLGSNPVALTAPQLKATLEGLSQLKFEDSAGKKIFVDIVYRPNADTWTIVNALSGEELFDGVSVSPDGKTISYRDSVVGLDHTYNGEPIVVPHVSKITETIQIQNDQIPQPSTIHSSTPTPSVTETSGGVALGPSSTSTPTPTSTETLGSGFIPNPNATKTVAPSTTPESSIDGGAEVNFWEEPSVRVLETLAAGAAFGVLVHGLYRLANWHRGARVESGSREGDVVNGPTLLPVSPPEPPSQPVITHDPVPDEQKEPLVFDPLNAPDPDPDPLPQPDEVTAHLPVQPPVRPAPPAVSEGEPEEGVRVLDVGGWGGAFRDVGASHLRDQEMLDQVRDRLGEIGDFDPGELSDSYRNFLTHGGNREILYAAQRELRRVLSRAEIEQLREREVRDVEGLMDMIRENLEVQAAEARTASRTGNGNPYFPVPSEAELLMVAQMESVIIREDQLRRLQLILEVAAEAERDYQPTLGFDYRIGPRVLYRKSVTDGQEQEVLDEAKARHLKEKEEARKERENSSVQPVQPAPLDDTGGMRATKNTVVGILGSGALENDINEHMRLFKRVRAELGKIGELGPRELSSEEMTYLLLLQGGEPGVLYAARESLGRDLSDVEVEQLIAWQVNDVEGFMAMIRGNLVDQAARARENSEYLAVPSEAELLMVAEIESVIITGDKRNRLLKEFKAAEKLHFAPVFGFDFTRGNPSPLVLLGGEAFGNPNAYREVAAAVDSQPSDSSSVGDQPPQPDDLPPPVLSEPASDTVESTAPRNLGTTRELSDPLTLVTDLNGALAGAIRGGRSMQAVHVTPDILTTFLQSNPVIFPNGLSIEELTIQSGQLVVTGNYTIKEGFLRRKESVEMNGTVFSAVTGMLHRAGQMGEVDDLDGLLKEGLASLTPKGEGWTVSGFDLTNEGQIEVRFFQPQSYHADESPAVRSPVVPEAGTGESVGESQEAIARRDIAHIRMDDALRGVYGLLPYPAEVTDEEIIAARDRYRLEHKLNGTSEGEDSGKSDDSGPSEG